MACCAILACSLLHAQEPVNLLPNGDFSEGLEGWYVPQSEQCVGRVVDIQVQGYQKALQLLIRPVPGAPPWAIVVSQPVDASVMQGEPLVLRFWGRSPQSCRLNAYMEQREAPNTKSVGGTVKLTPDWAQYEFTGRATQAFAPGQAHIVFHLSFDPGVIELAGVRLIAPDAKPEPRGEMPTVDKPITLIANGDFSAPLAGTWDVGDGVRLKTQLVDAQVDKYTRAVRLTVNPPPDGQPWSVGFGQACTAPVRRGDAVYFQAWMRSPDRVRVSFIWEMTAPPNTKGIHQTVQLTPEWKEYRFVGRAPQSFAAGESRVKWFLGYDRGVVEIAGVRVENYGPARGKVFEETRDYWGGREHSDAWKTDALARIEKIRKGDLTVRVVDAEGKPVANAQVKVEQLRHYFRFGTAAPAMRLVDTFNPDNLRFQQEVQRLFNTVTFENDLKWVAIGDGKLATVERAIEWLRARDIDVRGHCLLWGSYKHLPTAVRDLRGPALLEACRQHVTDYARRFADKVYLWDVVNEAGSNTEVWDNIGWENFPKSFEWARAAAPNVKLCYNDYAIVTDDRNYTAKVAARVKMLLEAKAPVDVLGIQAHMGTPLVPLDLVLQRLDEWAKFGKDLEITEFDVGVPDDTVHGEYCRDFMIACFSHPAVKSFIMWGFWEGSHWRSNDGAAMIRRDWTKRPACTYYEDLVFNQWWTRWSGATGADGTAKLRAFYGRHKVMVTANGKTAQATVELVPGSLSEINVVLK
jgi:GH35 family endo-1,4-beta-xylanase